MLLRPRGSHDILIRRSYISLLVSVPDGSMYIGESQMTRSSRGARQTDGSVGRGREPLEQKMNGHLFSLETTDW